MFRVAAPEKVAGRPDVFVDEDTTGAVDVVKPFDPLLMDTEAVPDGLDDPYWLTAGVSEPLEPEPEAGPDSCESEPAAEGDDTVCLGEDLARTPADVASAGETGIVDDTTLAPWTG